MRFLFSIHIWRKLSSQIHNDQTNQRNIWTNQSKLPASNTYLNQFSKCQCEHLHFMLHIRFEELCPLSQTLRHMSTKHLYPSDCHHCTILSPSNFWRFDFTLINTPGTLKSQTCWSGFACQFSVIFQKKKIHPTSKRKKKCVKINRQPKDTTNDYFSLFFFFSPSCQNLLDFTFNNFFFSEM